MIRILTILMGAVIFAAVFAQLVGYGIMYTVDQTEHAVITRFGNVQSVVSEPGLQFKSPIESVTRFDKRLCLLYTSPSPRDGLLSRMPSSA